MSALTNRLIERAKPQATTKFMADGDGLYLRIEPNGTKTFCYRYTEAATGKRKLLAIAPFPAMALPQARERAADIRQMLVAGRDPMREAHAARVPKPETSVTVRALAEEWKARYARVRYKPARHADPDDRHGRAFGDRKSPGRRGNRTPHLTGD
ncbi:Arm DNA-binding domain-containing protein [Cupriavidus taiwanensis]|uniref:Arm DNA-binding domain-containing protein n=1 Tax=Cupriavidus taiwanensis TaxID=164546 RepID=UPI003B638EB0